MRRGRRYNRKRLQKRGAAQEPAQSWRSWKSLQKRVAAQEPAQVTRAKIIVTVSKAGTSDPNSTQS